MLLVDTHCHLQSERYHDDRDAVIARALERLDWLVTIGDDLPNSEAAAALARDHAAALPEGAPRRIYATVAFHPYHACDCGDAGLARLRALAAEPGVAAIGEIGLDYFNEYAPRADQRRAFAAQCALACELGLPVCIHNREADADSLAVLEEYAPQLPAVIMHCFGSDAAFAERCVARGFYVSFAGNVTFPKAQPLRDAAAVVPLERLLVETDAPYLAPVPLRGKRCEPQYVEHTAAFLAQLKGVDPEAFGAATTANAAAAYGIPGNGGAPHARRSDLS